jgi:enamine deaminase RidA (YjgF/YER057c/UK114 family)
VVDAGTCATACRSFGGPLADELSILCRPQGRATDTAHQAEAIYRTLAALLQRQRASFRDLVSETLYLRDVRRDLLLVLDIRRRVLADLGQSACAPPLSFIQQPPVADAANVELSACAVIPHQRETASLQDVRATPSCGCEGCGRSAARVVRLGQQTCLYTTSVYGVGEEPDEQASNMFRAAERLLQKCGMRFHDVVRTWIYVRDIDRDYDVLNRARRRFLRSLGIELRPASTGVQGIPLPDVHDFSMSLVAVKGPGHLDVTRMSAPTLNEAWTYGADFSRGLRVVEANKVALYVSGTASIDDVGRSVHVGNFEAQAERMLDNIRSLLGEQGATFRDVVSGVTYLKNASDAPVLRSVFRKRGFDGFPCVVVEALLCRPEFLCETEAVALLPPEPPAGYLSTGRSSSG